jgi:Ca-activated chloride channel family protein
VEQFMDLSHLQSGVAAAWADVKQFLAAVRFARPGLLWLSLLPVVLAILSYFATRKRRKHVAEFGRPAAVAGLLTRRLTAGRLSRFLLGLGWTALLLGVAGPRWGKTAGDGVAVGRDVVVVLDFSRSMWATDVLDGLTPRWRAAVDGVKDLIATARTRGGHRIGVVVFAARPVVWVPPTTDYDHLDAKLDDLDAARPPNDIRPIDDAVKSGTRIGAALKLAVETHDPRFTGAQDIILLTDGDDPEDDREWAGGVTAARAAGVPVHVVGIGDPVVEFRLEIRPRGDELVMTKLHDEVAKAIATEGRGEYLPAQTGPVRLGEFFRTRIEPAPSRLIADDPTTRLTDRSGWFFAAAAVLLAAGWLRER